LRYPPSGHHLPATQTAPAAGRAPRRGQAPLQELASGSQAAEVQEYPAAACQGRGYQTRQHAPFTECLEAEQRARRRAMAPHDPMGCCLREWGEAPQARAMEPATRGRPVSDPVDWGCQPFSRSIQATQGKPSHRQWFPRDHWLRGRPRGKTCRVGTLGVGED